MSSLFAVIFAFLLYPVIESMKTSQKIESGAGYQCGHRIFTNEKIGKALEAAILNLEMRSAYPAPFKGSLYDDNSGFLIWPIKSHGKIFRIQADSPGPHLIVINRNKELVDVIVRLSDQSFTKCIKYDSSRSDISETSVDASNGYRCGSFFFTDANTLDARNLAMGKLGSNRFRYPQLIKEPLYDKKQKYRIWPILRSGRVYTNGLENGGPFYIVFDPDGKIIDVIARTTDNSFVKCLRERKIESASPFDPMSELFVPPPISGFYCGKVFFREEYVKQAASVAAELARVIKTSSIRLRSHFLEKYGKEPYPAGTYLWPLSASEKLHMTGSAGIFRVVLSSEFDVVDVIIKKKDIIRQCPKGTIKGKKIHDKNDYTCFDVDFSHNELLKTAEIACKKLNKPEITFPAIYEGPDFEIEGPYLTYPLLKYGKFINTPGRFRVIISPKCEVVGAIFKEMGRFFKCRKMLNGLSVQFFPDVKEPLIEEIY